MFTDLRGGLRGEVRRMGAEGVWYGGGGKARRGERKSAMGGGGPKIGGGYGGEGRRMPVNLQANK